MTRKPSLFLGTLVFSLLSLSCTNQAPGPGEDQADIASATYSCEGNCGSGVSGSYVSCADSSFEAEDDAADSDCDGSGFDLATVECQIIGQTCTKDSDSPDGGFSTDASVPFPDASSPFPDASSSFPDAAP